MSETFRVPLGGDEAVTAIRYPAAQKGRTLILAHGAGANQKSGFMVRYAKALAERGLTIVTFDFPYMEQGRKLPDKGDKLESCYRHVIDTVGEDCIIGGKSMGGRIATQLAARDGAGILGLVALGYPLHPPGKPEQLRVRHLPAIAQPMLVVQGSRDVFGTPEELRPFLAQVAGSTTLHVVEGGDHSFTVPKKGGVPQATVDREIQDQIARWCAGL